MRNTPYPCYSVGNRQHRIFDLHETRGLIQGITGVSQLSEAKVSDLAKFQHIKPGETKIFDKEQRVEIVSFGGHDTRGGFVSELETRVFTLEANAKFTGPIAWRPLNESDVPSGSTHEGISGRDAKIILLVILVILAIVAFLSPVAAAGGAGLVALFMTTSFVMDTIEKRMRRSVEKLGSIYVYAPSTRTWNIETTA